MENYFILICAVSAWFVAQFLKIFTGVFKLKKFSILEMLFGTGGMPSSHSATVCALATACGIKEGFDSPAFAIGIIFAMIVMRDAMGMRRQVGEHAKVINRLFKNLAESIDDPELTEKALEELAGHTPIQVFAGMILGILVPIGLMFAPAFGVGPNAPELAEQVASAIGNAISFVV